MLKHYPITVDVDIPVLAEEVDELLRQGLEVGWVARRHGTEEGNQIAEELAVLLLGVQLQHLKHGAKVSPLLQCVIMIMRLLLLNDIIWERSHLEELLTVRLRVALAQVLQVRQRADL